VLCGCAIIAVSGCALKAPPERDELVAQALPHVQTPPRWTAGGGPGPVDVDWIASFRDPQLQALVDEALAYNADLKVAAARVEQAAGYVKVAGATLLPAVRALAHGGGKLGGDDSGVQGWLISASWELDVWGRVRYGQAAAQAQYASADADYEYARQSLAALVAKSWFLASEARLQRTLAQDSVAASEGLLGLAQDRQRVGRGDDYELTSAAAALENRRDVLRQTELAYVQALRALETLLGRYPAAAIDAPARVADMPDGVPAGLPSEVLERRPDVIAAERRVAAAFNRVGEARTQLLPRIALTAGVSHISSDLFVLQNPGNPIWSLGANLVAPLFQGGALQAQIEIRTAEQRLAIADYARVAQRAFGEVENALSSEQALREREAILTRAVADETKTLDLVGTRFRVGSTDLRSVAQEQLGLYATQTSLLRVRSEQRLQRVNLHLALGGGFAEPERAASR
jgi:NodT family efflux transporter outer membrane factor (OMF) lipoprotein